MTLIFGTIYTLAGLFGLWMIFKKMGEPGWKGIIPFYNFYVLGEKLNKPVYGIAYIVGFLAEAVFSAFQKQYPSDPVYAYAEIAVGIAYLVVTILIMTELGKAFEKNWGFILGLIVLTPLFELILGLDNSQFNPHQDPLTAHSDNGGNTQGSGND